MKNLSVVDGARHETSPNQIQTGADEPPPSSAQVIPQHMLGRALARPLTAATVAVHQLGIPLQEAEHPP